MCDRHYLTVGYPYASFLLGLVNTATIAAPANPRIGKHQFGLFIRNLLISRQAISPNPQA